MGCCHTTICIFNKVICQTLTFITLWANSADDKLPDIFLILPTKQDLTFYALFAWNVKSFFLGKIRKQNHKFVVCWVFYPECLTLWVNNLTFITKKKKKKTLKKSCRQILFHMLFLPLLTCAPNHYENTHIQIYRKFHLQKLKIFR